MDDNFATIVDGIKEGRLIFANLKKCVGYVLTHIAPEIWPFLLYIAFGLPLALNSIQILMIDLGTELPPSLSLSWEPCEDEIMTLPPRKQVVPKTGAILVTAEQAQDLSAVPSFAVENVEEKSPKQKSRKWWQFYVNDKESQESSSSSEVRLVDMNILSWSYLIGGSIESLAGFAGFFWVFYRYGIGFQSLWGMAREGNAYSTLEPMDSVISGREYSGEQLKSYLAEAQTAYFMSIVIVQFFVLLVKKVDIGYPWGSQMLLNKFTYYAFIPSLGFALFCAYVPFMNEILLTGYLHIEGYIPAIIAGIVIFVIEFIRKANKKEQKEAKKHDEENPVTVNILKDSLLKHSAHSFEKQQHLRRSLNMNKAMKVG